MAKPQVKVRLAGKGVIPEETPAGELAELIKSLETSIIETVREQTTDLSEEQAIVSLIGIQEGSNVLTLALAFQAVKAVSLISQTIKEADYTPLPIRTHKELHKISNQAAKNGWEISFNEDIDHEFYPGLISINNPVPDPAARRVKGSTTLYGHCVRVGGAEPRAEIREKRTGKIRYIDINEEIARQLGRSLYEDVALEGEATWEPGTWELVEFKATRLTAYRSTDPVLAFKELAGVAEGHWNEVDVEKYVRDLRAEEEDP